jgi:3-deoxy-D-manno-octulosonate 8-phosphate phosphatase (KDO 8-P phosphatase)
MNRNEPRDPAADAPDPDNHARMARVKFLLTDVDGVLTDGRLYFDHAGNEIKVFHVLDGAGFAYWHRAGFRSGFLSGRSCPAVVQRATSLRVEEVHVGARDKLPVLLDIQERLGLDPAEIAYIGDDLLDLSVLARVGLSVTVPNGRDEVKERVHLVTRTPGGQGAVRELVEALLQAKGLWASVVASGGLG